MEIIPYSQDKLAQYLVKLGIALNDCKLTKSPLDYKVIGREFTKNTARITYTYPNKTPSTLLITKYELQQTKSGLSNAFYEIIWLLDLCKTQNLGIERVECTPLKIPSTLPRRLSPMRIGAFCEKILGATKDVRPSLEPYYYIDLNTYSPKLNPHSFINS